VGPAHHHGAGLGASPRNEGSEKPVGASQKQGAGSAQLEREARVHDVTARQPEVEDRPSGPTDSATWLTKAMTS